MAPKLVLVSALRRNALFAACIAAAGIAACSSVDSLDAPSPKDAGAPDAPAPTHVGTPTPDAASPPPDPFAAQPDESEGLTNVLSDLQAVLEHGVLKDACAQYKGGKTDRRTKLLCGKSMFFYETLGTAGMPAVLVKFLAKNFGDEIGVGFTKLGMVLDPGSTDSLPLGLAPTAKIDGKVDSLAFTCASCHFAQLSDGRYAVGAPNHRYDYGKHILLITLAPGLALGSLGVGSGSDHDPAAVAAVQPVVDRIAGSTVLKAELGLDLLPLLSLPQPKLSKDDEHAYASWPTGAMDFMLAPLPDDHVLIVGKMIDLWGIPRQAETTETGMSSALLGWTGATKSLEDFVRGFASGALGGTGGWDDDALAPLVEFIYSLRAPNNPSPPDPALVSTGATLFVDKKCISCHDGPRGSGKRSYTFEEIGTDSELEKWADPDLDGTPCCGMSAVTHGVKSPRLVGMWSRGRFLHNGSLSSLEEVFCLDGGRPASAAPPMRTDGHSFTCDGLAEPEKRALMAYLRAH